VFASSSAQWDHRIDIWAFGCFVSAPNCSQTGSLSIAYQSQAYELFVGCDMLQSQDSYDHSDRVQRVLGPVPEYLLDQPNFKAFADAIGMNSNFSAGENFSSARTDIAVAGPEPDLSYCEEPWDIWWPLEQNIRGGLAFSRRDMPERELKELIKLLEEKLLVIDPAKRATAKEIAEYSWLNEETPNYATHE